MRTLKLFNAVLAKEPTKSEVILDQGIVITSKAAWAKDIILDYYTREKLNGNDLNKSFHKSWKKIKESSRYELYLEQINHYMSTYGSNFKDEIYIPEEVLDIPDLNIVYKLIKAYTKEELIQKCFQLLNSGIALTKETIQDVLQVLHDELDYEFTGEEQIKNKEAIVMIADMYNVIPQDTMELFRYIIYRSTGETLLIKNNSIIELIKNSSYNPAIAFKQHGLEKLSAIFNRFKPLFLAFKTKCPKTINKIAKLSKKYHKPLVQNPLNQVTFRRLKQSDSHWLDNSTPYALFKALQATYQRSNDQDTFLYRIRNGKSWVQDGKSDIEVNKHNFNTLITYIKQRFDLRDKTFFLPENVKYALPTSEKMFVGNFPTGTKFYGKKLAVGIYWENSWGANDLDLSAINIGGKVGWNASYNQLNKIFFSGDITSAPNGAVEYLYAKDGLSDPTIIRNNVFSGSPHTDYKIIIGKGSKVSRDYMMDPNKVFAEVKCTSVQKETVLGMLLPEDKDGEKQSFVLLNFGAGNSRVSNIVSSEKAIKALFQQWSGAYSFTSLIKELGATILDTELGVDYDLSLENITKESFVRIFEECDQLKHEKVLV